MKITDHLTDTERSYLAPWIVEDVSWPHDGCPSFMSHSGHRVYCEAPDAEFRALLSSRFTVYASRTDNAPTYSTDRLEGLRDWLDAMSRDSALLTSIRAWSEAQCPRDSDDREL
jgi:hypothetical protein